MRLTRGLLETESVGFFRADTDQPHTSKSCSCGTPKQGKNAGDDFLAKAAFLETRAKNKVRLGVETLSRTDGFHGSGVC